MSHLPLHSFRLRQPHTGNQVLILSPPEAAGSQQSTEVQELEYLDDSSNWQCGVLLHKHWLSDCTKWFLLSFQGCLRNFDAFEKALLGCSLQSSNRLISLFRMIWLVRKVIKLVCGQLWANEMSILEPTVSSSLDISPFPTPFSTRCRPFSEVPVESLSFAKGGDSWNHHGAWGPRITKPPK